MNYRYVLPVIAICAAIILAGCGDSAVINKGITLKGHGEIKAVPDIAEINLTIQTKDMNNNKQSAIQSNAKNRHQCARHYWMPV